MRILKGQELADAAKAAYEDGQRTISFSTNKWYAYLAMGYGPGLGFMALAGGVRTLMNKNWDNKTRVPLILQQADAARVRRYGNCGEYTCIEFQHLMQKDIGPLDFMTLTDGDHAFCLLNRPESSDPTDASTWGREVWVIDGWKGELFDMPDPMRFEKIVGEHKYDTYVRWP